MIKKLLIKTTKDASRYRLVFFNDNNQIIWKDSNANNDEAEYSIKIAEFKDEARAIEYWDTIK